MKVTLRLTHAFAEIKVDEMESTIFDVKEIEETIANLKDVIDDLEKLKEYKTFKSE
jgi:tetrahydromethanopterin S-methyltransferase subunit B